MLQAKSGTTGGFRNVLGLVGLGRSCNNAEMNMMMYSPEESHTAVPPLVSVQPVVVTGQNSHGETAALGVSDTGHGQLVPPPASNQSLLAEFSRMGESLNISEIDPPTF